MEQLANQIIFVKIKLYLNFSLEIIKDGVIKEEKSLNKK
jgi:hypothetical protein